MVLDIGARGSVPPTTGVLEATIGLAGRVVTRAAGANSVGTAEAVGTAGAEIIRDDKGAVVTGPEGIVVPYPENGTNGFNGAVGGRRGAIRIGSSGFASSSAWMRIIMTSCAFLYLWDKILRIEKRKPKNNIAVTTESTNAK
jgi:hypothetical protein